MIGQNDSNAAQFHASNPSVCQAGLKFSSGQWRFFSSEVLSASQICLPQVVGRCFFITHNHHAPVFQSCHTHQLLFTVAFTEAIQGFNTGHPGKKQTRCYRSLLCVHMKNTCPAQFIDSCHPKSIHVILVFVVHSFHLVLGSQSSGFGQETLEV